MANINDNRAVSASQTRRILAYMQDGNRITPLVALDKFGCLRLGARIADIEKLIGYAPARRRIKVEGRSGRAVWVAEYWLEKAS